MNTEQLRAEFEAWRRKHYDYDDLNAFEIEFAFAAYQAGRAALQSQGQDGARLDWLQQHDERFYNLLRITSIVNKGFSPTNSSGKRWFSSIREAIDHARRVEGQP